MSDVRISDVLGADDLVGVLGREVGVGLVNISASGCLIESTVALEPGTVGMLQLHFESHVYSDDVRIARCQVRHGTGAKYHLGAEFLWTSHPGRSSLRRLVSRFEAVIGRGQGRCSVTLRIM